MLTDKEIGIADAVVSRKESLWSGWLEREDALQAAREGMISRETGYKPSLGNRTYYLWRAAVYGILAERECFYKRQPGTNFVRQPMYRYQKLEPLRRILRFELKYLSCNGTEHRIIAKDFIHKTRPHWYLWAKHIYGVPFSHIARVGRKSVQAVQQKAAREVGRLKGGR